MNLGGSVEIEYPQEEQRGEQWRQGGQEEGLAGRREWAWQGGEMTESDEAERRERKREIDLDKGEGTADDEMSENSDVREKGGRLGTSLRTGELHEMPGEPF